VTCTVVQEREQPRLYGAVSRAVRTGTSFAVLDPTWPPSFLGLATGQIQQADSDGVVIDGDMVVFSSGSTGRPRGIVRTVESWRVSVAAFSTITGITADDTVWLPGPLWSSLFLYGAFHAGAVGAQMIFRDDNPCSATALHCVPSQLPGLLRRAGAGGLPLVRRVVVAGDHCAATLRQRCEAAGWHVVEYYGAAELSLVAWRDRSGPFRACPGVEIELRTETALTQQSAPAQQSALTQQTGPAQQSALMQQGARAQQTGKGPMVLWAHSPYLATDYLSAGDHGPLRRDSQGWATVQDLARAVPGGLEIVGRGTSAVTSGGHTVVVEDVERLLLRLPGVDEVAVLGVPHPQLGQVLTAVVVGSVANSTLRTAVAGMPAPSRPRRWLHVDALPHTSAGKLRRDALPDLVLKLTRP
jgi:acyl-coenzyme A synthetase/AMP-(fatty) acid ligase